MIQFTGSFDSETNEMNIQVFKNRNDELYVRIQYGDLIEDETKIILDTYTANAFLKELKKCVKSLPED